MARPYPAFRSAFGRARYTDGTARTPLQAIGCARHPSEVLMTSTVEHPSPPDPGERPGPALPPPAAGSTWPSLPPPAPPYADNPRYDGHEPAWRPGPPMPPPARRPPTTAPPRRPRSWPALVVVLVVLLLAGSAYALTTQLVPSADVATGPRPSATAPPSTSTPPTSRRPWSTTPPTTPDQPASPNAGGNGGNGNQNPTSVDWNAIAEKITPGMVFIETRMANGIGAGTGMILTADGTVLTNNHVIDGASSIVVTTAVDGKMYRATVVGAEPHEDVAVIKLTNASGLTPIPLGDSSTVQIGDPVAGMGNAGGTGTNVIAPGSVEDLDQQLTATDQNGGNAETITGAIQVQADIVPGHSGGPLVSADAKVVGIDTAASADGAPGGFSSRRRLAGGEGFAIPINHALDVAKQLETSHKGADNATANGAYLGVEIVNGTAGADVVGVAKGGPAERAGLAAGSTITAFGGTPVSSAQALSSAVQAHRSGDRVPVTWTDANGQTHQATISLG